MKTTNNFHTFFGHISILRQSILSCVCVILIGFLFSLFFYQDIVNVLTLPLQKVESKTDWNTEDVQRKRISNRSNEAQFYQLPTNASLLYPITLQRQETPKTILIAPGQYIEIEVLQNKPSLVALGPLEGILTSFKLSFWIGIIVTAPFWIYFLLRFILPGLYAHEKKFVFPFLVISLLSLGTGFVFAYLISIPFANYYLHFFNSSISTNLWSISAYIDFTLTLALSTAFAFELFGLLLFLVHVNFLTAEMMSSKRRHMIVAAFIIGAVLTPPDVFTQFLLAIPLIVLYELAIAYAHFRKKRIKNNVVA